MCSEGARLSYDLTLCDVNVNSYLYICDFNRCNLTGRKSGRNLPAETSDQNIQCPLTGKEIQGHSQSLTNCTVNSVVNSSSL